ncbi:MAG TPA: hypothetical protein DDW52_22020 [Planctomycetaceae bacterium]|nr:hypothetical protein [Planctomycetaceae bacterium]
MSTTVQSAWAQCSGGQSGGRGGAGFASSGFGGPGGANGFAQLGGRQFTASSNPQVASMMMQMQRQNMLLQQQLLAMQQQMRQLQQANQQLIAQLEGSGNDTQLSRAQFTSLNAPRDIRQARAPVAGMNGEGKRNPPARPRNQQRSDRQPGA